MSVDRERLVERMECWKRCIDGDDFTNPGIVRSHFNDLYWLLAELLKCLTGSSSPEK